MALFGSRYKQEGINKQYKEDDHPRFLSISRDVKLSWYFFVLFGFRLLLIKKKMIYLE